jgi:hypothetical protein
MKNLVFVLGLISIFAQSGLALASSVTTTVQITDLSSLNMKCYAGLASNGHNYPTSSQIELSGIYNLVPGTNVTALYSDDPHGRSGDYCAVLESELQSLLPATMTITQTRSVEYSDVTGTCLQYSREDLYAKIGDYFFGGYTEFNDGPTSADKCSHNSN